jgi:hypothetical protein
MPEMPREVGDTPQANSCPRCGQMTGHSEKCPAQWNPLMGMRVRPFGPEAPTDRQCSSCGGFEGHWAGCRAGFEPRKPPVIGATRGVSR